MNLKQIFNIDDLHDLPLAVTKVIQGDQEARDKIYFQLMDKFNYDFSYDWFQKSYEDELAQRKQNKQDFTPNMVGKLASALTGHPEGKIYEPTAGNGSMIITDWWNRCQKETWPGLYQPSKNMVYCCELSARSIPILLLNLSIRGIMGYVYHGDVLEQKLKMKYILLNRNDNPFGFSEIIEDKENNKSLVDVTNPQEEKVYRSPKYF